MKGWRHRRFLAVGLGGTILAIQLLIPISLLASENDESVRFGWQMFSSLVPSIEFTVVTDEGDVSALPSDYLAQLRGDVPILDLFPPHLCEVIDNAESVTWPTGRYECQAG